MLLLLVLSRLVAMPWLPTECPSVADSSLPSVVLRQMLVVLCGVARVCQRPGCISRQLPVAVASHDTATQQSGSATTSIATAAIRWNPLLAAGTTALTFEMRVEMLACQWQSALGIITKLAAMTMFPMTMGRIEGGALTLDATTAITRQTLTSVVVAVKAAMTTGAISEEAAVPLQEPQTLAAIVPMCEDRIIMTAATMAVVAGVPAASAVAPRRPSSTTVTTGTRTTAGLFRAIGSRHAGGTTMMMMTMTATRTAGGQIEGPVDTLIAA